MCFYVVFIHKVLCLLVVTLELLAAFRLGELVDKGVVGIYRIEVAVGLLLGYRVVGKAVARHSDMVEYILTIRSLGKLLQGVAEGHDGRLVTLYLEVGVGVDIDLLLEAVCKLLGEVREGLVALRLRVSLHKLGERYYRLRGYGLISCRAGCEVVVTHCQHRLGILEEGAATKLATELLELHRSGGVVAIFELAACRKECYRVLTHRAGIVCLTSIEEVRSLLPLLQLVVLYALGVDKLGVTTLDDTVSTNRLALLHQLTGALCTLAGGNISQGCADTKYRQSYHKYYLQTPFYHIFQ